MDVAVEVRKKGPLRRRRRRNAHARHDESILLTSNDDQTPKLPHSYSGSDFHGMVDIAGITQALRTEREELLRMSPLKAKAVAIENLKRAGLLNIWDFCIIEDAVDSIKDNSAGIREAASITITCPTGMRFAEAPKIEVIEGNMALKSNAVLSNKDTVFTIPIDTESTRPSSLRVSEISITVDQAYPEEDTSIVLSGSAVSEDSGILVITEKQKS